MRNLSDQAKKNKQKYDHEYTKNNYDRAELILPKGYKTTVQAHAADQGESFSAFVLRAIKETIERDESKANI